MFSLFSFEKNKKLNDTSNDKSFEVELLMLRIAYLNALLELEEARPNVSKEMFRFAEESLNAAFKLEKAKLVACDEEKVQYAEKSHYEAKDKIGYLFEKAGFALVFKEIEGENVLVIDSWDANPGNIEDLWDEKIDIPAETDFFLTEDEDAENK